MGIKSWQLEQRLRLPLEAKEILSGQRIRSWYDHWFGQVYISFSGGKDSTVLLHLVRRLYPNVEAVFIDTGLEFPEIRNFVKTIDNVTWIKPKINFKKVIEKYGYPIVSKQQAQYIHEYNRSKSEKLKDIRLNGNKWGMGKISKKWLYLLKAPFKISHKCCDIMKKNPAKKYEKESNNKAILGTQVGESYQRKMSYLQSGCNAFNNKRPMSTPLAFWTEEDIWNYIKKHNLPYSDIYNMGYERTGCMFCMFGINYDGEENRFQKMKKTHPKQYDYCINHLGCGKVLDFIDIDY